MACVRVLKRDVSLDVILVIVRLCVNVLKIEVSLVNASVIFNA
jgi:hypothetical protein